MTVLPSGREMLGHHNVGAVTTNATLVDSYPLHSGNHHVFFCDCRVDRYIPKSQVSTWGHIKSWNKCLDELRLLIMIGNSVLTLVQLLVGTFSGFFKWLFPTPTPEQKRRRRKTKRL